MRRPLIFFFAILSLVSGCATKPVASMQEVLSPERLKIKNCYLWSVNSTDNAKAVASTVPLIPLMIIFPPAILVTGAVNAANSASDMAVKDATKKCSLTTEEAREQAAIQSYMENSGVRWWTKIAPFESIEVRAPVNADAPSDLYANCKVAKIETRFTDEYENANPRFSAFFYYQVCRNNDGEAVVTNKEFPKQTYAQLVPMTSEHAWDATPAELQRHNFRSKKTQAP